MAPTSKERIINLQNVVNLLHVDAHSHHATCTVVVLHVITIKQMELSMSLMLKEHATVALETAVL